MKLALECHEDVTCHDEHVSYRLLARAFEPTKRLTGFKVPRLTEQLAMPMVVDHDLPRMLNPYRGDPLLFLVRDVRDTVASMMMLRIGGVPWLERWGLPSFEVKLKLDREVRRLCQSVIASRQGRAHPRVVKAALYWRYKVEALFRYRQLGYPLHLVRYEDLVCNPRAELEQVCAFLGLRWSPSVLLHHVLPHTEIWADGLAIGGTDPKRPIDKASVSRWRGVISDEEATAVLYAAGPAHKQLYPKMAEGV